jgi:hypothetical protein
LIPCGGDSGSLGERRAHLGACGARLARGLGLRAGSGGAAEEKRLYIYNWTDFIGRNTIEKFERLTGIKVVYDVYDAEETMEARLMAGELRLRRRQRIDEFLQPRNQGGRLHAARQIQAPELEESRSADSRDSARLRSRTTRTRCLICTRSTASPTTST